MKYADALRFLDTGVCEKTGDYMHDMVAHEIEYFLKSRRVSPKVFIAYDRAAYFLKTDKKYGLPLTRMSVQVPRSTVRQAASRC